MSYFCAILAESGGFNNSFISVADAIDANTNAGRIHSNSDYKATSPIPPY